MVEGVNHTQPTFTFCPVGEVEDVLPRVDYCSFARELSIKSNAPVDREWGPQVDPSNCVTAMQNQGLNLWQVHPVDPACWVLGPDPTNQLIPARGTENMFIVFSAEGIGMRVWNSTAIALSEDPSNSTKSQGVRMVFGSGDLVQLTETSFQRLNQPKEATYDLNQFGSFPLAALEVTNVTIIVISWATDQIYATNEKETISTLTLVAIITGAVAVAIDLLLKNFALLFYQLFVYQYPGDEATVMKGSDTSSSYVSAGAMEL